MIGRLTLVLGTVLGLQCLRALFPLLVYGVRDRFGVPSLELGGWAAALFALSFALPATMSPLPRAFGIARTVLLLGILRGLFQFWPGDPLVSLGLAAAGVVVFLTMLVAGSRRFRDVVDGILPGALLDTALHALAGTRDLHWGGRVGDLGTLALVLAAVSLALLTLRSRATEGRDDHGTSLFAWGPYLFLHLELLGNVARFSAHAGTVTEVSGVWVGGGLALGWLLARGAATSRSAVLLSTVALLAAIAAESAPATLRTPIVQVAAATLLAAAMRRPPTTAAGGGAAFGIGSLLFLLLLFGHYAGYDLPLPVGRRGLFLLAGALLGLSAWVRVPRGDDPASRATPVRIASAAPVAAAIALLPLLRAPSPPLESNVEMPMRVVSFNLHNGFDEKGGFALDRMLDRLMEGGPTVVALQEVSRGWVVNGSADLYELARERTGLSAVFGPSVGGDWGNAVLVRGGIAEARTVTLPPAGLRLPRAFTEVAVPRDDGSPVRVAATHFHHLEPDEDIRVQQAAAVAEALADRGVSLVLGDVNAVPTSAPATILREAGWIDVAGEPEAAASAFTFPSSEPARRIDVILRSGDVTVHAAEVAPDWGSDHRAVTAQVSVP